VVETRELYASSNGDRWLLAHDPGTGRVLVRHEPNPASGGRATELGIAEFLARDAGGPEHQALLRLVGSLLDDHGAAKR
jgi:hypothetical protein